MVSSATQPAVDVFFPNTHLYSTRIDTLYRNSIKMELNLFQYTQSQGNYLGRYTKY